jgi:hypothetical protein
MNVDKKIIVDLFVKNVMLCIASSVGFHHVQNNNVRTDTNLYIQRFKTVIFVIFVV